MNRNFKFRFKTPPKSDIIVFDEGNSHYIIDSIIKDLDYFIFCQRPEKIYISFKIFFSLIKNIRKFQSSTFNIKIRTKIIDYYRLNLLYIINPKVVITYVDNSEKLGRLKTYYNKASFISIQCGTRISSRRNKEKQFIHQHFICYGQNDVKLYSKWNHKVDKFHPIGSLKVGLISDKIKNYHESMQVTYDLCMLSIWRPMKYKSSSTYMDSYADLWYTFDKMNDYLAKYVDDNDLNLCIAMREKKNNHYSELGNIGEEHYLNQKFGESVDLFPFDAQSLNSYKAILHSNIVITTASTLLLESLAMGRKGLYCDFTGTNKYHRYDKKIMFLDDSYDAFSKRMDALRYESYDSYYSRNGDYIKHVMNNDKNNPPHKYIRKLINNIMR